MLNVRAGALELLWDEASRLAVLGFDAPTDAKGAEGKVLVESFERWVGQDSLPFALISDGGKLRSVDAEYRAVWGAFFREHRDRAFVAFFNMGPLIRVAAEMFRIGTGVQLRGFPDEASARRWLRGKGIGA